MFSRELKILCNEIVIEGCERLGLSMGIVSHIDKDSYEIVAVYSKTGVFVPGEIFPLSDTYCRDVYSTAKTIALTEIEGVPGLQLHPLYHVLALEAYISTPIFKDGLVWGTLNFSCMRVRRNKFSDEDINYVEACAVKISALVSADS